MLARLRCQHAGDGVPVVGGGNHHGVDVLAGQQLAEVVVGGAAAKGPLVLLLGVAFLDDLAGIVAAFSDDVADGDDLHVAAADKVAQVPPAHRAHPDEAEREAVIGTFLLAPGRGEKKGPGQARSHAPPDKLPARPSLPHRDDPFLS
jgi:hypothetical protein